MAPEVILVCVSALLATIFALDYGLFSAWWRHYVGWVIFAYAVSMVLVLATVIVSFFVPIPVWVIVLAASCLSLALLGKIVVLHIERHRGNKRRHTVDSQQTKEVDHA